MARLWLVSRWLSSAPIPVKTRSDINTIVNA